MVINSAKRHLFQDGYLKEVTEDLSSGMLVFFTKLPQVNW